jgi:sarcosine oxidase gamma subunit
LNRRFLAMNQRVSPIVVGWTPQDVEILNGWPVTMTYKGERTRSGGLCLTDVSHVPKWAFHTKDRESARSFGIPLPEKPGQVTVEGGTLAVRLKPAEGLIMVLRGEAPMPEEAVWADMTDGYAAFALVGPQCFEVLGKLSSVDLAKPGQAVPFAAQAPVHDLRCAILRLEGAEGVPGLIILSERGYGGFLSDIVLDAGEEFGLSPAGWRRFEIWLKR